MSKIKNAEDIKRACDVYRVISQFIELKRAGVNYTAKSPMTGEKTASFVVSPAKNIFSDFSAGHTGKDAIFYLMEYQDMTYPESLEYIAKIEGITIQYARTMSKEEEAEYQKKLEVKKSLRLHCKLVLDYYWAKTWGEEERGPEDELELGGRSLTWKTIEAFKICMGSTEMYELANHAKASGWDREILVSIGALYKKKNGAFMDTWRDRILTPISDRKGEPVGFSARATKKNQKAKYLNSPESELFQKRELLLGVAQNKVEIKRRDLAVLVEGPWDVFTPFDMGLDICLASNGTALTIEQAQLIRRYSSRVLILNDGDKAGQKATHRNIPVLLDAGLLVEVATLPEGQDPDSFLRNSENIDTGRGMEVWMEEHKKEGIQWMIQDNLGEKPDLHRTDKAIKLAGRMISKLTSDSLTKMISKEVAKVIGCNVSFIKEATDEQRADSKKARGLTPEQDNDLENYGFFEWHNSYWFVTGNNGRTRISNFVIEPIFLLRDRENPKRLIKVLNNKDDQFTLDVDTDALVDLNRFKKVLEANGDFLFEGSDSHWIRIKRKIYDGVKNCFPIYTLGWHPAGFYAFGNGILVGEEFQRVDKYGIVQHNKRHYFLPAFSEIYEEIQNQGDDLQNDFDLERKFVWRAGSVKFEEWAELFLKVHGREKGITGILFYMAALYYDYIFPKIKSFPLLNCFGLPGSGKTYFCNSLMVLFGDGHLPVNLRKGSTHVGIQRSAGQIRNGLIYYNEFKNSIDPTKIEILKGFYDRSGHAKGKKDRSNKTQSYHAKSAIIFDGQHQPNADIALYQRVIPLEFNTTQRPAEAKDRAEKLMKMGKKGELVGVTCQILALRPVIEENWDTESNWSQNMIRTCLKKEDILDRYIDNFSKLLTVWKCLENHLEFPWKLEELMDVIVSMITRQANSVEKSNELGRFWDLVEYMSAQGHILEDSHFKIRALGMITLKNGDSKTKRYFDSAKHLLFLPLTVVHPLYMQMHRQQFNEVGLDRTSLAYYMKSDPTYLGMVQSARVGSRNTSCFIFDYDKLERGLRNETTPDDDQGAADQASGGDDGKQGDIPF